MVAKTGFKWIEVLEREFDTAFVDLDSCMNNWDEDSADVAFDARTKMTAISSAFAQLVHKSSLVFEVNAKLEQQLAGMREDLIQSNARVTLLSHELADKTRTLNDMQSYTTRRSAGSNFMSPEKRVIRKENNGRETTHLVEEINALRKENKMLRNECLSLQSNLFGAQLATKYLDKELAGRIQQIQLLAKSDLRGVEHDRLWNQLEAEIHLHRHKTVVKACRGRIAPTVTQLPANRATRVLSIEKGENEGLGISITGGKEHGIPVIVSEVHTGSPAFKSGSLYVGDAILSVNGIDLREVKHNEAASILTQQQGNCMMEVLFVYPEEEVTSQLDHREEKYPFLDPGVMGPELSSAVTDFDRKSRTMCIRANEMDGSSSDDNVSSITDTMTSCNRQTYPGVARLCLSERESEWQRHERNGMKEGMGTGVNGRTCSKKETTID